MSEELEAEVFESSAVPTSSVRRFGTIDRFVEYDGKDEGKGK